MRARFRVLCTPRPAKPGTLLPSRFQVPFTTVPGGQAMAGLLDDAKQYLSSYVWMNNDPWLLWDAGGRDAYNWTVTGPQAALDDGMYDTTLPVKAYDATEIGYPFRTTIWAQCHGLLHQVSTLAATLCLPQACIKLIRPTKTRYILLCPCEMGPSQHWERNTIQQVCHRQST